MAVAPTISRSCSTVAAAAAKSAFRSTPAPAAVSAARHLGVAARRAPRALPPPRRAPERDALEGAVATNDLRSHIPRRAPLRQEGLARAFIQVLLGED